jgi:hypothetical protein
MVFKTFPDEVYKNTLNMTLLVNYFGTRIPSDHEDAL